MAEPRDQGSETVVPAQRARNANSRIPTRSATYSRLLPALILGLAIIMLLLVLVAVGVLLGLVPYR